MKKTGRDEVIKDALGDILTIKEMTLEIESDMDDMFKITTSPVEMRKDYKLITLGSKSQVINMETYSVSDISQSAAKVKFGKNGVEMAPHFEGWSNEADNLNYKLFNGKFLNSNSPLPYIPKKGPWPTIEQMLRHCCGTEYSKVLQYYCNMIKNPRQRLPLILLLSAENNTGKTTMVEWTARMMGENAVKIRGIDISDKFSGYHADKQFGYVDEALEGSHKYQDISVLKDLVTADVISVEIKNQAKINVKNNLKIMMCSNDVYNAIAMEGSDTRVWPFQVPVMKKGVEEDKDTFKNRLNAETPGFLWYLIHEMELPKPRGRLYFSNKEIENELKVDIKKENKPEVVVLLESILEDLFAADKSLKRIECTSAQIKAVTKAKMSMNRINQVFVNEGVSYLKDDSFWYQPILLKVINGSYASKKRGSHFTFYRRDYYQDEEEQDIT